MILTGKEIGKQVAAGNIRISPFDPGQLNPNSYNYRLGELLRIPYESDTGDIRFETVCIPEDGYLLQPRCMVLGHTLEELGSNQYAMSLIGRSSLGRVGLFLQISANLGHTTSCHRWTLELFAAKPILLYKKMTIGQISFWANHGDIVCMGKTYANFSNPTARLVNDLDRTRDQEPSNERKGAD